MHQGRFFTRSQWLSFWLSFLGVWAVYIYTLAPSVTLEDSGELVTAAAHFGVPHPPGYPLWTLVNWLFIKLVPFGNVAWKANLCSSLFGALTCGVIGMITAQLAERFCEAPAIQKHLPASFPAPKLSLAAGTASGLSLGFLESLWYQSVITEVYSLAAFLFAVVLLAMLRWLHEPDRLWWGILTFFVFGLAISTHQTLLLFSPAILIFMALVNWRILRDILPYVLMAASTIAFHTGSRFVIVVTAVLFLVYGGLMIHTCWRQLDLQRGLFIGISLVLPALAGFLAAESVNDVELGGSATGLADMIRREWAMVAIVFVVLIQMLFSYVGSWRPILPYALTVLCAAAFRTGNEFAVAAALFLLLGFALLVWREWRGVSGPMGRVVTAFAVVLPILTGAMMARCLGGSELVGDLSAWVGFKTAAVAAVVLVVLQLPIAVAKAGVYWRGRPALALILAGMAGLAFHVYMPLASSTNPPMNWSYTRTAGGFIHSITRGQYDAIREARTAQEFVRQVESYYINLTDNYSLPIALLCILSLIGIFDCELREKKYAVMLLFGWVMLSLVLTYLLNTSFEEQTLFINRVFYISSHEIFSIWLGLGIVMLCALVNQIRHISSWILALVLVLALAMLGIGFGTNYYVYAVFLTVGFAYIIGLWVCFRVRVMRLGPFCLILFLPAVILVRNEPASARHDWTSGERGHDFGWRYGYDMLRDLDRDAVLFGGTDQGRFVPTYMIFCESFAKPSHRYGKGRDFDRRDVYIITQNALADSTYMDYIRDHYDVSRPSEYNWFERRLGRDRMYPAKPLRIPTVDEYGVIFDRVATHLLEVPGSGMKVIGEGTEGRKLGAESIGAVFAINAAIAKDIFEKNKRDHTFYVEESLPLDWMYPYLEPHGLCMKLSKEPMKSLSPEVVARDMEYWRDYTHRLLSDPLFLSDIVARRSFSKLRSSIGGVYLFRKMEKEAEMALLQALALYGGSAESATRLIDLYARQERFDRAKMVANIWLEHDPQNRAAIEMAANVDLVTQMAASREPLKARFKRSPDDMGALLDLVAVLLQLNRREELDGAVSAALNRPNPDPLILQRIVTYYSNFRKMEWLEELLKKEARLHPENMHIWYHLAVASCLNGHAAEAVHALGRVFEINPNMKSFAAQDPRLTGLQHHEGFRKLIGLAPVSNAVPAPGVPLIQGAQPHY